MSVDWVTTDAYDIPHGHVRTFVLDGAPAGGVALVNAGFKLAADEFISPVLRDVS